MQTDNESLQQLKEDYSALVAELEMAAGGPIPNPRSMHCPFHPDRNPSSGVYQDQDGRTWMFKCQGCGVGGTIVDVRAWFAAITPEEAIKQLLGRNETPENGPHVDSKQLYRPRPTHESPSRPAPREKRLQSLQSIKDFFEKGTRNIPPVGQITHEWPYVSEEGELEMIVWRLLPDDPACKKEFRQAHSCRDGWVIGAPHKPWPLYNRDRMVGCRKILFVEGEQCAEFPYTITPMFSDITGVATTAVPFGSSKVTRKQVRAPDGTIQEEVTIKSKSEHCDLSPLAGKEVYFFPDNDEAGIMHMKKTAELLSKMDPPPALMAWIEPSHHGLGEGEDIVDLMTDSHMQSLKPEEKVRCIVDLIEHHSSLLMTGTAGGEVLEMVGKIKSDQWELMHFPEMDCLTQMTKALQPEALTILCGRRGTSKSLLTTSWIIDWHERGVSAEIFMGEKSRKFHMMRALAMRVGKVELMNPEWCKKNIKECEHLIHQNLEWLNSLGRRFKTQDPSNQKSGGVPLEMAQNWFIERAKAGVEILIFDPIMSLNRGEKKFVADDILIGTLQKILSEYGTRIILVTHPADSTAKGSKGQKMMGSAGYSNLADTELWLCRGHPTKKIEVQPWEWMGTVVPPDKKIANRYIKINKARLSKWEGAAIGYNLNSKTLRHEELGYIIT